MKVKQKAAKSIPAVKKRYEGFTDQERGAMQDRVREMKVGADKADGESALQAKLAEMTESDRALAKKLHAVIKTSAPSLSPTTWYGMPAYTKDGKLICHFVPAQKFKTRYATLGFSDKARLDEGDMWPNAYAVTKLTPAVEAKIAALVKKAIS
jgi:uncharacterized protein YdhG (YjbR/CyaY superfamily)